MDSTHLHLVLNHFPIIGTLVGIGIMIYGYFTRSIETQKAALLTWVLMALIAIPVFVTGEPAEESVENLAGVSEGLIERHESLAKSALIAMEALGAIALITLFVGVSKKTLLLITFALSLITFGLMARTGYLGGQIRHTEIRTGASVIQEGVINAEQENEEEKDDD